MNSLWLALGFLTSVPVPRVDTAPGGAEAVGRALGRGAPWFPVVGLLLGLVVGGAHVLLGQLLSPLLAAALVVLVWVVLTGGLHLDGLADCCDGLFVSAKPARRMEIMRDAGVGAFGAVGLVLLLILKVAAVAALAPGPGATASMISRVLPFVLAASLARWLILPLARGPRTRPSGLGAGFAAGLRPATLLWAAPVPLALVVAGGWRGLRAALPALVLTVVVARLARARIGGVTGDVLGANVELTELAVLLAYGVAWESVSL